MHMPTTSPEKIDLRPETTPVKETTQASSLVEVVAAFVNTIQKINDLGSAQEALVKANDLFNAGNKSEAKDLSLKIFERLKQIGKMPSRLDIATIQRRAELGQYKELSVDIEKVREQDGTKNIPKPKELVERLGKISEKKKLDPKDPEFVDIKTEMNTEVTTNELAIKTEERRIQAELAKFLEKMEKATTDVAIKVELHKVRGVIDAGFIGQVDAEQQIDKLRDKIGETVIKTKKKVASASAGDWAKVAGNLVTGNPIAAMDQYAGMIKKGPKGEQIFVSRLEKLVKGMDKVKEGMGKGLGIQEAARTLDEGEIREVRAILSSVRAIPDPEDRSPYYDEKYVDFIADMEKTMGKDELLGFAKMLDAVDINYSRARLESDPEMESTVKIPGLKRRKAIPARVAKNERFIDDPLVEGERSSGMKLGLMSDEQAEMWYEDGREFFDEIMEELPSGGFREKDFDQQLKEKLRQWEIYNSGTQVQKNEQRESFLNINMKELFDYMKQVDKDNGCDIESQDYIDGKDPNSMFALIDYDYWREHQVAKLKEEFMVPQTQEAKDRKKKFEDWWYQEVSFNQRGLAYEGLFERRNQSPRMQRLNSLMEIIGVSTAKKGLANWMSMSYGTIDQQNNSYVNAEFMGKLATFWTNQGVDFRLEDMLKEYREEIAFDVDGRRINIFDREGKKVSISVFDTTSFMQRDVPPKGESAAGDALRKELGIPDWWKGKFGTMIYKYSESSKRDATRRTIWNFFLENELNVDLGDKSEFKIDSGHQQDISNRYGLMFDLGFQYSVVHKQLNMMIGNSSFQKGELELPAACVEMHLKLDPLAYPKLFAPRFQFLNVAFKEVWALFDPGVRDYITMAPQDYASHYMEKSIGADGLFRSNTDPGAPTIGETFLGFGASASAAELKAEDELFKVFNGSLWHWGVEPGKGKDHEMDIYLQLGVHGDQKSAFRRGAGDMSKQLRERGKSLSPETLALIKWDKYLDIAKNPIIKRKIDAAKSPLDKWNVFADTFGEHSFNHSAPAAKRSGDHPVKYSVEKFNKYVEAFLAFANDPFTMEKLDAILDVPTEVNAAIVNGLASKNLDFVLTMSERMGRSELMGGHMHRFKRDPKKGTIHVNTSHGLYGDGDNEWPAIEMETIKNGNSWFDPVQNKSIPESVGVGVPVDKQILLDLIKGQRAKGRLPDETYRKYYRKITNSVLWEKELGPIVNLYKWITFEPILEWIAPQLGITGHELRHIISENTEKTTEKFLHYLNGGGGH